MKLLSADDMRGIYQSKENQLQEELKGALTIKDLGDFLRGSKKQFEIMFI